MRQSYVQEVTNLIHKQENIRNISVIAHVDHGKTTLVDSLLAKAGIIKEENAEKLRVMDTKVEEQQRGITIKSTGISLLFEHNEEKYVVNLVDSPGHIDFSSEVTAALRITDGALVVVDCIEGVCVQTETVTRQAITERIRPVLHINKIDRAILELGLEPEDLYQKLNQVLQDVNAVLESQPDEALGDIAVDPVRGNVSFGSGKQGWAFTLPQFAEILGNKTGKNSKEIVRRLWGDNFYDPDTNKFTTQSVSGSGKKLERYVCQVLFKPLLKIFSTITKGDIQGLEKMLPAIGVKLANSEKELPTQDLLSRVLQLWIPAGTALSRMIIEHLPSPVVAQNIRMPTLYTGPLDDECATAIRKCDPQGPVMMFVSKMVPTVDGKRFYAFGRIFSGTLRPQQEVRIMGPNFEFGRETDFAVKKIQRLVLMMGRYIENIDEVPCGNTVGIAGLDNILVKSGTISSSPEAHSIAPMKFSVSPVVRVAVAPKNPALLPKFISGLKRLEKSDPCLQVIISDSGECIIAGAGELHVETALTDLKETLDGLEFSISPPVVEFCESVRNQSSVVCLGKSPNKHNRLYVSAEPLSSSLVLALERKEINLVDKKVMIQQLVEKHGWDVNDAKKVWFFCGTNCVVDTSRAVQYLHEIKDHINAAFEWVVSEGALCGEPMRGVRFNVCDAILHADTIHRGGGQIIPPARRVFLAAQLAAFPTIMEPIYLAEIKTIHELVSKVYSVVSQRRGCVIEEIPKEGTPITIIRAYLPVLESFGFDATLRASTSGRAFPQLMFSHWQMVDGAADKEGVLANTIVKQVRNRKLMKEAIPVLDDYNDQL